MGERRVVLFDLGGVLFDYSPARRVTAIAAACRIEDEDAVRAFIAGPINGDLDLGLASLGDLAAGLSRLADGRIAEAEAARLWLSVFRPDLDLWQLAAGLAEAHVVGVFSNNPPFIRTVFPPAVRLAHTLLSSEIAALKPAPASFKAAEAQVGARGDQIVFIDDAFANVMAARQFGWTAIHYRGFERLLADLRRERLPGAALGTRKEQQ